jgi:hypothetical protein
VQTTADTAKDATLPTKNGMFKSLFELPRVSSVTSLDFTAAAIIQETNPQKLPANSE